MDRGSDPVDIRNGISAAQIIAAMKGLLAARREQKISRPTFLRTWTWLRRLLNLTDEYARWRWHVRERAGGACERCAEQGNHAHHRVQVVYDPDRAVDPTNGEYLCVGCHKKHHKQEAAARRAGRPTADHPARTSQAREGTGAPPSYVSARRISPRRQRPLAPPRSSNGA